MKILAFPGASLMELTPLEEGLCVRCPGCGAVHVYRDEPDWKFGHEDGCPVHARIEEATRRAVH